MKFGEMLDWALRLRALGALRAWVGARGPTGGIGADGLGSSRFLEADRHLFRQLQPQGCRKVATITISGDFRLDADLVSACASECDFRT